MVSGNSTERQKQERTDTKLTILHECTGCVFCHEQKTESGDNMKKRGIMRVVVFIVEHNKQQ